MKNCNGLKVSIIIPTYGRPRTLKRAIESVLMQTYSNYEIIVVDDNNPDTEQRTETENLMLGYSTNNKITYIRHKENKNGAAARNTGFKYCTGEFVCFLDDDDWFLPEKLKIQVELLLSEMEFQAVYCGWIKREEKFLPKYRGVLTRELLLMDYEPMTPTLMFRREVISDLGGFDESFRRHQDYELMLRFFCKYKVSFVNQCLVGIGVNDGENSLNGKELEMLKKNFLMQFQNSIYDLDKSEKGIGKKIHSKHYARVFLNHVNHGYYKLGFSLLIRSFVKYPVSFSKEICSSVKEYVKHKRVSKNSDQWRNHNAKKRY